MKTADPRIIDDVWRIARQRPFNMQRGNQENEIAVNKIALVVERLLESLEGGSFAAPHSGRRALLEDAKQAAIQLGFRLNMLRSSYATKYVQDLVAAIDRDLEFTPEDKPNRTGPLRSGRTKEVKSMEERNQFAQERLLSVAEVVNLLGIGRTTWWCGVRSGIYPQPVKLSPRTTRWRTSDIAKLIEQGATEANR